MSSMVGWLEEKEEERSRRVDLLRSPLCGTFMATAQAILGPLIWFGFIFNNLSLCVFLCCISLLLNFFWGGGEETMCTPSQTFFALLS